MQQGQAGTPLSPIHDDEDDMELGELHSKPCIMQHLARMLHFGCLLSAAGASALAVRQTQGLESTSH